MRESLVGLGHTVHVFTLLDSSAFAFSSIQQLTSHRMFPLTLKGIEEAMRLLTK